jgi:hypothetical protein
LRGSFYHRQLPHSGLQFYRSVSAYHEAILREAGRWRREPNTVQTASMRLAGVSSCSIDRMAFGYFCRPGLTFFDQDCLCPRAR